MRYWLLVIFLFLAFHSIAQKETSHWFLNGSQVLVTPSGISNTTPSGTAGSFRPNYRTTSVSDAAGNLLFASEGNTIIDKNFGEMPAIKTAGLGGARKLLAIKVPGSDDKYYLFFTHTTYAYSGSLTCYLNYALIDLSLNNGAGDVSKIQVVDSAVSEAFTLVQSATAEDAWLVAHKLGTNTFLSYQITATGISPTAVTSIAGSVATVFDYAFMDLKTSPDGKMIGGFCYRVHSGPFAEAYQFAEVFNFNFGTGIVSNRVRSFRRYSYFFSNFSVEFSPDNRLFYACVVQRISGLQIFNWAEGRVYQYNLCYTDSTDFDNYSMMVADDFRPNSPTQSWGQMQLGADKRFYMPFTGTTISGINYPNRIGTSSGYHFNVHQAATSNFATVATPNFEHRVLEKAVKNNIVYLGGCFPNPTIFRVTNDTITNIDWDFGDPSSGSNTSSLTTPGHLFSAPGMFTVTAKLYSTTGTFIENLRELVEIKDPSRRLLAAYPTDTSFCQGGHLKLNLSTVNGVFRWTMRGIYRPDIYNVQTSDSIDITSSGTYFVEMRQNDCDGCTLIDSIHITVLPSPYFDLGADQNLCSGDSLKLQVYEDADYLWSTGATSKLIWIHSGGKYWVRGEINNNGCPQSDTITIKQVAGVQFAFPADTTLCNSSSLLLDPGVTDGINYRWQDGTSATKYTVTQPGKYWVQITNSNNCRQSDSIVVSYVNAQQVFLGNDTTLCMGDSLILQTDIPNAQYVWSTFSTLNQITVKQPGTYWLKVDNGSCAVADTITINFHAPPIIRLGNDTTLCEAEKLVLHATASNAFYLWSDGNHTDSITILQPGSYFVDVNQAGCRVKDTIQVSYKPRPTIWLGRDTSICAGKSLVLNAAGSSLQSYLWQNGSSQSSLAVAAGGNYWVKVTGINGCLNADTITVNIVALPNFSLGNDTVLCESTGMLLQFALPNASYQWNTGNTSNSLIIKQPGLFWLDVTQNGCVKRDSLQVNYKPMPQVFLGNDTTLCEGSQKLLDATNSNASYHWQDGSSSATYLVSKPGTYNVTVNMDGCAGSDTLKVNYNYKPHFTLGRDTSVCEGMQLLLDPHVSNVSLLWQDGSTGTSFTVKDPGIYRVTASNSCGSTTDEIQIERGVCQLLMPSAFTPNGDGVNDLFRVKYPGFIESFSMKIYNRWGQVVFLTENAAKGWDGKYSGIELRSDVFVWEIVLTTKQGRKMTAKGTVMLIR